MYSINQIVRGKNYGVFVILGFLRLSDGTEAAQLKELNPDNLTQHAPGELRLPLDAIQPYYA